jgi:hypothetical protein
VILKSKCSAKIPGQIDPRPAAAGKRIIDRSLNQTVPRKAVDIAAFDVGLDESAKASSFNSRSQRDESPYTGAFIVRRSCLFGVGFFPCIECLSYFIFPSGDRGSFVFFTFCKLLHFGLPVFSQVTLLQLFDGLLECSRQRFLDDRFPAMQRRLVSFV